MELVWFILSVSQSTCHFLTRALLFEASQLIDEIWQLYFVPIKKQLPRVILKISYSGGYKQR